LHQAFARVATDEEYMTDQTTKFERFKALHQIDGAFVMPNPWDAGSARLLASLGFEALATTSAGFAFSKGKRDSFAGLRVRTHKSA
jgi:2-methylisocitrate lyase-like PEP mutase family enzyme